jgi:hypothetical protein
MGYPGARIATVLIYAKAPDRGGETEFPEIGLRVPIGKTIPPPFLLSTHRALQSPGTPCYSGRTGLITNGIPNRSTQVYRYFKERRWS